MARIRSLAPKKKEKKGTSAIEQIQTNLDEFFPNRLAGWRHDLDLDGDMSVSFGEFCKGIANLATKCDWVVHDLVKQWVSLDIAGNGRLCFAQVSPYGSGLLEAFRAWVASNFMDPVDVFVTMDKEKSGSLTMEQFVVGCQACGFLGTRFEVYATAAGLYAPEASPEVRTVTREDLEYLFIGFDYDGNGSIQVEEVIFLQNDAEERAALLTHVQENAHARTSGFFLECKLPEPSKSRPWSTATKFEVQKQQQERERDKRRVCKKSANELKEFLYMRHGNLVRAWRRGMNPQGVKRLSRSQVLQYCCHAGFKGNAQAAFTGLDKNELGYLHLEDFDSLVAHEIEIWRMQMEQQFGSVIDGFDELLKPFGGLESSRGKFRIREFTSMLTTGLGLQDGDSREGPGQVQMQKLFDALDLYGWGYVSLPGDFKFVMGLDFAPWVGKAENPEAADMLRQRLMKKYGNYISAWSHALDKDSSNEVTWKEFQQCCKQIRFDYDVPGSWRALDDDFSGVITLKEIDQDSYDLICDFKTWAEEKFGSVLHAYEALDQDQSNELTRAEFKTAARFYGWKGDAPRLFAALAPKRKGSQGQAPFLTTGDMAFLDQWVDPEPPFELRTRKQEPKLKHTLSAQFWRSPARRERLVSPWGEAWVDTPTDGGGWVELKDPRDFPQVGTPKTPGAHSNTTRPISATTTLRKCATWADATKTFGSEAISQLSPYPKRPARPDSATLLERIYGGKRVSAKKNVFGIVHCDIIS